MKETTANTQRVDIETKIKEEQVRLVLRLIPFGIYVPPISSAVLALLLWGHVDETVIFGWLTVVLCGCSFLSIWVLWHFKKLGPDVTPKKSLKLLMLFGFVVGLSWGSGGYLLFTPDSFNYLGLLFLWMYLPAASGTMLSFSYTPLFHANLLGMLTPLIIRCLEEGDPFHLILAITTVIYIGCLKFTHHNIHRIMMESIRLRFEKSDLLKEVTYEKEAAERANIAKSRFLAAANHDLRQPLHAQTLFLAELKEKTVDQESIQLIQHLESTIESMNGLFNSLLDISKLDAEIVDRNISAISISTLLERLQSQFASMANCKGLRLRVLPCSTIILSDPSLLDRILHNLLANAINHTNSGSVMVCCRRSGTCLRIEVRDSGPGIPQHAQEQIFDEFFQLQNPERDRDKGLGLGLAIVSRMAKLLDHEVDLRSSPGRGSVFSITVPICDQRSPDLLVESDRGRKAPSNSDLRILVIDNEASIRTSTQGLLQEQGYSVITASVLDDAIQTITQKNFKPQVVISDYRLPGNKNGIDSLNYLRTNYSNNMLGILITGDTSIDVLREADSSGYYVLYKPIILEKLYALLEKID